MEICRKYQNTVGFWIYEDIKNREKVMDNVYE